MGSVARRGLYAVCTDWKATFLTSPHTQLSVNMLFALVSSSQLARKGSYGVVEPENVNPESVRKAYRPARNPKLLRLLQRRIGPSMEICANSGLPPARCNVFTNARCTWKGSYGVGEPEKCKPWVGAKNVPTCTGLQTTLSHAAPYTVVNGNLPQFAVRGYLALGMFAPMQSEHEKEAMG